MRLPDSWRLLKTQSVAKNFALVRHFHGGFKTSSQGKPFYLYRRNRIYYCRFKLPNSRLSPAKSTGETSKGRAERWAVDYLQAGQIVHREKIKFNEYSKGFFSWDETWATDKRVRGLRISKRQCHNLTYLLNNHLLPRLGSMCLSHINRAVIRELRNDLFNEGYSGNTINKILYALRAILETAEDQALIQFIPKIDRAADNPKQKGILTIEEVKKLFSIQWISEPTHCHPPRNQFMGYAGNLLACSAGLRTGELQALTLSDIHLDESYIFVRRSWDKHFGLNETTKTGRTRNCMSSNGLGQIFLARYRFWFVAIIFLFHFINFSSIIHIFSARILYETFKIKSLIIITSLNKSKLVLKSSNRGSSAKP